MEYEDDVEPIILFVTKLILLLVAYYGQLFNEMGLFTLHNCCALCSMEYSSLT